MANANGIDRERVPLMLIHGAWLSSRSWDPFAEYFRDRGYDVSAPEWPRKQADVEELREAADAIVGLGLTEIVDHKGLHTHRILEILQTPSRASGHT